MTVEKKRKFLIEHCDKMHVDKSGCDDCPLLVECLKTSSDIPAHMNDTEITRLFSKFEKLKGDKTMEERTITITTHEYKGLVADQAILAKLEVYTETHEYLNDDVIRALLGVPKPSPVRIESEGD